jgi:orotate phosphoribosyltransferase
VAPVIESLEKLRQLPLGFTFNGLTKLERQDELLHWFRLARAVWQRSELNLDPAKPHVRLRTGLCTNGYFNCSKLLQYPNVAYVLARELANELRPWLGQRWVDWVVGSAYAAITFSHLVALHLGCRHAYTEKLGNGSRDGQILRRFSFESGETVLDVEELTVTKRTPLQVAEAVAAAHSFKVSLLPHVGSLVFRPGSFNPEPEGPHIVTLVNTRVLNWSPQTCPYCEVGSPIIDEAKDIWVQLYQTHEPQPISAEGWAG